MAQNSLSPAGPLLGAHTSIAGGASKAIDRALAVGCAAMQIFVKSNRQWSAPPLPKEEARAFREHPRRGELGAVFAHNSYLINPAAPDRGIRAKSVKALIDEVGRASALGLPWIVLHPGAHLGTGLEKGIAVIVESLDAVTAATRGSGVRLALETTAGQGTTIGDRFEHLGAILDRVKRLDRYCVCVDTAHLVAAGYEIASEAGYRKTFREFDRWIGLERLAAFHLNDSKAPLGSRKDRHEHIGKGHVGLEAFRRIVNDGRFRKVPMVLETPKGVEMREDRMNLAVLRGLMA